MEKIQDYVPIGDCRSMGLISKTGALDWLCWPRFDSPPIFSDLLDVTQGRWKISPVEHCQSRQKYVGPTVVLETIFETFSGKVVLTDLMPAFTEEEKRGLLLPEREIIRKVECVQGSMDLDFSFSLCGQKRLRSKNRNLGIRAHINGGVLILNSSIELNFRETCIEEKFTLHEGETAYFSLSFSTEAPAVFPVLDQTAVNDAIGRSIRFWEKFASRITYEGSYRETVIRSALTLKLMNYAPSGAFIASPTTSLPEKIGGKYNWDYRYCWLREASLTVEALASIGLKEEAQGFVSWLLHTTNLTRPRLKAFYDVYGQKPRKEKILDKFKGYMDSFPVRTGNQACEQEQLDIYGEVICGAVIVLSGGPKIDRETQRVLKELGEYICQNWAQEDSGMWEASGRKELFTHSLLMCWAGLQGLLKLFDKELLESNKDEITAKEIQNTGNRIAQVINILAWNQELETFTSTLRGTEVDADLLLLSWHKFPAGSGRLEKTHEVIRQNLSAPNGLLFRNRDMDEGVFILCGLREVAYLAQGGGSLKEAEELFEHILSCNNTGLFSEAMDPVTGDLLGNFPLAFTHSGIINAAVAIEKRKTQEEKQTLQERSAHELGRLAYLGIRSNDRFDDQSFRKPGFKANTN